MMSLSSRVINHMTMFLHGMLEIVLIFAIAAHAYLQYALAVDVFKVG